MEIKGGLGMKLVYRLLFALHIFVGSVALVGGSVGAIDYHEPFGMSVELLRDSPFNNYLIPGIMLFTIIGIGNIFCAFMFSLKLKFQAYISCVFSYALVIWVVVQCIMLNNVAFRNVLFLIIGIIQAVLSMIILFDRRLFPVKLIQNFISKATR